MIDKIALKELVDRYLQCVNKIGLERYIDKEEGYKFRFIANFQKNFDIEAKNLSKMLESAIENNNLVLGFHYFPRAMLLSFAEKYEKDTSKALQDLFDEKNDVATRIDNFKEVMDKLMGEENKKNNRNDYSFMGTRFISLLLSARYPEKYYPVKALEYKRFAKEVDKDFPGISGLSSGEKYSLHAKYAEELRNFIRGNAEIKKIHSLLTKNTEFKDPEYIWMAQDVIFTSARSPEILGRAAELTEEEEQRVAELIREGKSLREIKKITLIERKMLKPIYHDLESKGLIGGKTKEKNGDIFEETEEEQPLAIPQAAKKVVWQPKDYSIRELYEMYKDGELFLQSEFQRLFVWDPVKSSRLIESIFLDVPIPVIYFAEEENSSFAVIDGQQRLKSFFDFIDGDLKLRKLLVLPELNDKKYIELSNDQKSKFKKATLHIIVVKKESQKDIRFEIFERLNTGAVKLNDQELRNCMFRGIYNKFLRELAEEKDFLGLLGLEKHHKRMVDVELVLRFFAFYHSTYLRYEQPMKSFLNNEMLAYGFLDEREKERLKKLFKKSIDLARIVFGGYSFRRFVPGNERDCNGNWEGKKINKALFDVVMYGFTEYEKHQIVPRIDAIKEELLWLMTHDQEFIDSVTLSTNDKSRILARFEKWLRSLREIVGYPQNEPRAFSIELKTGLYRSNSACKICGQSIQVIDDAEVDHVDFYWRGGKTISSNARLTHRYCNRHRGGRD